ncbi:hypothetical protein [Pedosphaera parvula]|uniref:Glycosyl transferase family 11 n=1 Tax=Pedosphaera parvula (strain Ellin514) TaxID=320771 RepID=B9XGT5_PEDPL|nr:hypothetical protein [Pedosphaera parvula]EEF60856.1 conserved hypothetical protein [Pedosphaera parvula Ellin514]
MRKKVFITDYVGLSTKLETLALAFVISDRYGHDVCLDWPELKSFNVAGARKEGLGLTGRIGALRLRNYSDELFSRIKDHNKVILRTHNGPAHLLERVYIPTAKRVKLRPDLVAAIRTTFSRYANRPVVGVHIRRGDFQLVDDGTFDVNRHEWPATPTWWYEHVMGKIAAAHKDVAFYVSCTGDLDAFDSLKKNFDVFEVPTTSLYSYKGPDHDSKCDPAADLFALGCCSVLVASACSTFSHYAANALGGPTTCLIPPPTMTKDNPGFGKLNMYGKGAALWCQFCREGLNTVAVNTPADIPEPTPASCDWL